MGYGRYRNYDDDGGYGYGGWPRYVPVAERKRKAAAKIESLKKKGEEISPVMLRGRTIASTFWGKAWCENLEAYSDYSNRLPRGRTYVRNGSVLNLHIVEGKVKALVQGSSLYKVEIAIRPVETPRWRSLVQECSGKIDSLVELLQGKFATSVMAVMTNPKLGLFPAPKQITLKCSCPDWATMCKHVAAVLYGIGSRLDEQPELLFVLRKANHLDLITHASVDSSLKKGAEGRKTKVIEESSLATVFGIELDSAAPSSETKASPVASRLRRTTRKPVATKRGAAKRSISKLGRTSKRQKA
ncbi:MAG: hypothetical protein HYR96_02790 [Deltaproteobacteria bacterium]|nr:hypothetical protein [Deltaproteobacteria bacterium]